MGKYVTHPSDLVYFQSDQIWIQSYNMIWSISDALKDLVLSSNRFLNVWLELTFTYLNVSKNEKKNYLRSRVGKNLWHKTLIKSTRLFLFASMPRLEESLEA